MAHRRDPEGDRGRGAFVVVALIALSDALLIVLLATALVLGRPVLTAVLVAVVGAAVLSAVVVAVAALLATRGGSSRDERPEVVVAERPAPDADPAFRHDALKREAAVALAGARLESARLRGAPLAEVLALSVAFRRARLDHAEALLAAGADLPEELLLDLADREADRSAAGGADLGVAQPAPYPRGEAQVSRQAAELQSSEGP